MQLQVSHECYILEACTVLDLPTLSCSMLIVWLRYIAKALHHVSFSFWTLLSNVPSNVISIITENMPLPFFPNSHILGSSFNIEYFIGLCAVTTPRHKI